MVLPASWFVATSPLPVSYQRPPQAARFLIMGRGMALAGKMVVSWPAETAVR